MTLNMAEDKATEVKLPGACAVLESDSAGEDSRTDKEGSREMDVGGAKMRLTTECKRSRRVSRKKVECSGTANLEQAVERCSSGFKEDVQVPLPFLVEPRSCSAAKTLRKEVLIRAATFNELDSKNLVVDREMCVGEEAPQPVRKLVRNNTMPEICYQCLVSADVGATMPSTSSAAPTTSATPAEDRQGGRDSPQTRSFDVKKYVEVRTLRKDSLIRAATFNSLDTRTTLPVPKETTRPVEKVVRRNNTMPEICFHCLLAADITVAAPSSSTPEAPPYSTCVEEGCPNHNTFLLSQNIVRSPTVTLSLAGTRTPPPPPPPPTPPPPARGRWRRPWASWPYDHFDMRCFVNAFLLLVFGLVPWVVALITLLQDGNHVLAAGVAVSLLLLACILVLQIAKRRRATSDLESQRQEVHAQQYLEAPPDYELLMAKPPPYELLYEVHHCPTTAGSSSTSAEPSSSSPRLLHLYRTFKSNTRTSEAEGSEDSSEAIEDDDDLPSYDFAMRYCNLLDSPTSLAD